MSVFKGGRRYTFSDYNVPCKDLATKLLGKVLVRKIDSTILKGKIVETECYLGVEDKASHSYNGRRTERNEPMFMPPGTSYVYLTYGMYHCVNISSQGEGAAVLLRAVEPLEGLDHMRHFRTNFKKKSKNVKELKDRELCNGPSKLCISFQINKNCNMRNLCDWEDMWIEDLDSVSSHFIVNCPRIGIDSSGKEVASLPLRHYIYNSIYVSKKDKKAEAEKFQF